MAEEVEITHRLLCGLLNMMQYPLRKRDVDIKNKIYDFKSPPNRAQIHNTTI